MEISFTITPREPEVDPCDDEQPEPIRPADMLRIAAEIHEFIEQYDVEVEVEVSPY